MLSEYEDNILSKQVMVLSLKVILNRKLGEAEDYAIMEHISNQAKEERDDWDELDHKMFELVEYLKERTIKECDAVQRVLEHGIIYLKLQAQRN